MANRVVITICGEEYTFVAEESASYMQKVGTYVGDKMFEILNSAKVGRTDAAILTAANIADELFKAQAAAEQLRAQIKGYLDEAGKAQAEASELRRELFRLQQKQNHKGASPNCCRPQAPRRPCGPPCRTAQTPSIWAGVNLTRDGAPKISQTRNLKRHSAIVMPGMSGYSSP